MRPTLKRAKGRDAITYEEPEARCHGASFRIRIWAEGLSFCHSDPPVHSRSRVCSTLLSAGNHPRSGRFDGGGKQYKDPRAKVAGQGKKRL